MLVKKENGDSFNNALNIDEVSQSYGCDSSLECHISPLCKRVKKNKLETFSLYEAFPIPPMTFWYADRVLS